MNSIQLNKDIHKYLSITKSIYLILDNKANILLANDEASKVLGLDKEKLVGMNWVDNFIPKELQSYIRSVFIDVSIKNLQINEHVENEIITMDGRRRFISWRNSFIEEDGKITQILSSGEDITEKKAIQRDLEEKEDRLKAIFDYSPLGVIVSDKLGKIVEANYAFLNMLGYSLLEITNKTYRDITDVEFLNENDKLFNKLIDNEIGRYRLIKKYITKNGNKVWANVTVSTIKDDYNETLYILAVIEDITEKKKQEDDIIAQRRFLHTIIDENPNVIIVKDYEGRFVLVNKSLAKLYNSTTEEMIGKTDADYNKNQNQVEHYLKSVQEIMESGETKYVFEESTDAKTGKIHYYQSAKKPIIDRYGNKQILIIANDITEIKEAQKKLKDNEEMLHHQSKMAAMGEMLENIAHQWRQPLSVITTSASSISLHKEMESLTDDFLEEFLHAIIKSANHLSQTIDDFRDFFKPDKEKTFFKLGDSYKKALFLLSSKLKNREIFLIEDIKDVEIRSFDNELVQVLMNLINNARDALVEKKIKRYIFITIYEEDNNSIIKVKDNSGGIPVDIIGKVFEPYFTTKHKSQGTGIGLYMCEEILVKHMNGSISVANVEFLYEGIKYKGAEFTLTIPLYEE